ncbi:MAG: cytochrome c [Bryobacteraceae bacterium]|nr:cytochrome c [Bryobacteraceae bacterium]
MWRLSAVLAAGLLAAQSPKYGVGRTPGSEEIRALGATVAPDGTGLPEGSGSAAEGRPLFASRCARCHGDKAEGDVGPALVGGKGTLATAKPIRTVGSFWSHATSVWNYVHRAMPFDQPGLLTHSQVYSAVAYILFLNGIVGEKDVLNARTLPKVRMPNRDGFVPDPRPDIRRTPR